MPILDQPQWAVLDSSSGNRIQDKLGGKREFQKIGAAGFDGPGAWKIGLLSPDRVAMAMGYDRPPDGSAVYGYSRVEKEQVASDTHAPCRPRGAGSAAGLCLRGRLGESSAIPRPGVRAWRGKVHPQAPRLGREPFPVAAPCPSSCPSACC
ncbi:hypothetical protein ACFQ4Q_09175 [Lysobacter gummosus]|uniref:hypothetical protein n=1 Tax=Lysobacter gummosus TaxID=262324 RepID=UPI0036257ACD